MCYELGVRGLKAQRQVGFVVKYKGRELKKRLIIDVVVDGLVIVETKAFDSYHSIFEAQLLTYLRQTNRRLGLVINFGRGEDQEGNSPRRQQA